MADIDLTAQTAQGDGQGSVDATLANNRIDLPEWANELNVYLDNAAAGSFSRSGTASGRPLPGQTWTRVWRRLPGRKQTSLAVWVASASGSVTLHWMLE